jgi:hypothetical protein
MTAVGTFVGSHKRMQQCLLLGEKPTRAGRYSTSAFDPHRTLVQRELAEIVATDKNFTLW